LLHFAACGLIENPVKPPVENASKSGTIHSGVTLRSRHLVCDNTVFSAILDEKVAGSVAGELGHGVMAFFTEEEIFSLVATREIEDACTSSILFKRVIKQKSLV
jgi:hypothetical protein